MLTRGAPLVVVIGEPWELFGFKELVTAEDNLPYLPSHLAQLGGIDGFCAARLVKH